MQHSFTSITRNIIQDIVKLLLYDNSKTMSSGNTVTCQLDPETLQILKRIDNRVQFLYSAQTRDHNPHYHQVLRQRNGGKPLQQVRETSDEDSASQSDNNLPYGVQIENPSADESELEGATNQEIPSLSVAVQTVVAMAPCEPKTTGRK